MSTKHLPGKVITFYSYKGGTGRSMAVANIAWILASNGKSVLVLDWDLEAPGLHRYFRPFLIDKELTSSNGIIDFVIEYADEAIKPPPIGVTLPEDWFVSLADITRDALSINFESFPEGGSIAFIPAGRQGAAYATRVNSFDWKNFYTRLAGKAFLEEARRRMCQEYEYILIDSRTGVSDTAGICTIQMPDILAVCFTLNNQSVEGAAAVTKSVDDQRRKKASGSGRIVSDRKIRIVPIPMRIDPFEKDKLDRRRMYAQSKFKPYIQHIPAPELSAYWVEMEVPYTPYFGYEELLSTFRENPSDPKSVLAAMIRITNHLIPPKLPEETPFSFTSLISPERNDEILQEFASTPGLDWTASHEPAATESELEKQLRLAEAIFQSLNEQDREEVRLLWTRLVRVPRFGELAENSKVRVNMSDLSQNAHPLVQKLAESELLLVSKDEQTGQETVEISNEDLLRSWRRLRKWIADDVWLFRWRQALQTSKAQWDDKNHNPTELLGGRELDKAKEWYKSHRTYLSDGEAAFIEASIAEEIRIRDEQIRIRDEQVRRRRLRLILTLSAFLLTSLIILSAYYYARRSNKNNVGEELATQAQQLIDAAGTPNQQGDQFQLGILLATEAGRLSSSAKAEAILRKNLPLLPRRVSISTQTNNVLRASITPNGSQVLAVTGRPRDSQSLSEDRVAQLQETLTGKILGLVRFPPRSGNFEISPDGKYLATAVGRAGSYSVGLMDMTTGKQVASINHKGVVYKIAFSPNGRYLATASRDGTAQLLDILNSARSTNPVVVLRHLGPVNEITFSSNSQYIATAGEDYLIHVRPTTTTRAVLKDKKLDGTAFVISLGPRGEYLATISLDSQLVKVWRVDTWELMSSLANDFSVNAVTFSPDSKFVITAGNGGSIRVYRNNGELLKSLRFYGDVDRLIFSADGKYLAAIGNSNVAWIWSYNDGRFDEAAYLIQGGNFNDLAFGSDNRIVTAGADNTIRVWDTGAPLTQDMQQSEPCSRVTRNLTIEEWERYLAGYLGTYRKTCSDIP